MVANIEADEKLVALATELFVKIRKCGFSLVFISESCFKLHKVITLSAMYYFIIKLPTKRTPINSNKSFF